MARRWPWDQTRQHLGIRQVEAIAERDSDTVPQLQVLGGDLSHTATVQGRNVSAFAFFRVPWLRTKLQIKYSTIDDRIARIYSQQMVFKTRPRPKPSLASSDRRRRRRNDRLLRDRVAVGNHRLRSRPRVTHRPWRDDDGRRVSGDWSIYCCRDGVASLGHGGIFRSILNGGNIRRLGSK